MRGAERARERASRPRPRPALTGALPAAPAPAHARDLLAGLTIRVNDEHWQMMITSRSWAPLSIIMCNHASRIDWLLAEWCGNVTKTMRVSFLTEGTMQFMPVVGWVLKLREDIFLWRSFKTDKPAIDANIESFKRTGTRRALFLAIEGAIVDQGAFDKAYIAECNAFCESLGYAPFQYVLTPRYKGIHSLAQHAGSELFSATTAFVRDGELLNKKLTDPERVVPDLFTILSHPVDITCHFDRLQISAEQDVAKRQCMDNYKYRDSMIAHFDARGHFPGNLRYEPLPRDLPKRLGCFALQLALAYVSLAHGLGRPLLLGRCLLGALAVLGGSHWVGEVVSGQSRESIPFETLFKSYFYAGRDEKLAKKAERAAKRPPDEGEGGLAETLAATAKMLSLATKFPAN